MGASIEAQGIVRVFDKSAPSWVRAITRQPEQRLVAVDQVSLTVQSGQTFALVGESGSGKSTLARILVGLDKPTQGAVLLNGERFLPSRQEHRRQVQMIFQSPYASLNPRWRVADILAEPIKAFGLRKGADVAHRVSELLSQVGLSASDGKRFPHEFSGGQRQRISIARALASEPSFLVCDEPTSALDVSVQAQVLNLLKSLQRELGLTYLFITHDLAVVRTMAHEIGVLKNGQLVERQSADDLFRAPQHEYTQMLLRSAPVLRRKIARPETAV